MSSRNAVFLACIMACAVHAGCSKILGIEELQPPGEDAAPPGPPADAAPPAVIQRLIPAADKLDLLFVIDDTAGMGPEQRRLAEGLPSLFERLQLPSGLPDLHVGIVSTNMGAHPNIPNCTAADSDDGALQFAFTTDPAAPQCSDATLSISGNFLSDAPAEGGTRATNYTGGLTQVLSCMVQLGEDGCGFEQPLAAMVRAFENPVNAGFLRTDATLAVVFYSEEDDCSAFDTAMFDPTETSKDGPLGPLDSFRCFEFGVQCEPDEPRALGEKRACVPRKDSPYMYEIDEFVTFLNGLKRDPQQLVVAGIVGVDPIRPDEPLEVFLEPKPVGEVFSLAPACVVEGMDPTGSPIIVTRGMPAVRLRAFLEAFPGRTGLGTICEQDAGALDGVGMQVARALEQRWCLTPEVDRAPEMPGIQHECQVREVRFEGNEIVAATPLAECSSATPDPGELPCWRFAALSNRCPGDPPVELQIRRAGPPADGAMIEVTCNPR